jgi:hypothetical protein
MEACLEFGKGMFLESLRTPDVDEGQSILRCVSIWGRRAGGSHERIDQSPFDHSGITSCILKTASQFFGPSNQCVILCMRESSGFGGISLSSNTFLLPIQTLH